MRRKIKTNTSTSACTVVVAAMVSLVVALSKKPSVATPPTATANAPSWTETVADQSNAITLTLPPDTIRPDDKKVESFQNTQSSFVYELKPQYSSRSEILQEQTTLLACYKTFVEYNSDELKHEAALITKDRLMAQLDEELIRYPLSQDEIQEEKIKLIETKMLFAFDILRDAEAEYRENPSNAKAQEFYLIQKEKYEGMKDIFDQYQNEKISIDQALSLFGIVY